MREAPTSPHPICDGSQPIGGEFTPERIVLPVLPVSQARGVVIIAAKRRNVPTDREFFEIDIDN